MNKFVALFALVAVAFAEPEAKADADAQFYGAYPYHGVYGVPATHATVGAQVYANGAVVPQDTLSVKAAKAQHFAAKASEYAKKGVMPFYGGVTGYTGYHMLGKREAESDAESYWGTYGLSPYTGYTGYTRYTGYASPYAGYTGYTGYSSPYVSSFHSLGKREAEAESDAESYWGTYGLSPYSGYTGYTGYASPYTSYTGYNRYTTPYTGYTGYNGYHMLGKRSAEAEADSQFYSTVGRYVSPTFGYRSTYGGVYGSGVYGSAYRTPYVYGGYHY